MKFDAIVLGALAPLAFCGQSAGPVGNDDGAPIRTERTSYTLQESPAGFRTGIAFTYVNDTGETVYLHGCRPPELPKLQKKRDGEWVDAWLPVRTLCLSQPVPVEPGDTVPFEFELFAGHRGSASYPQFEVDVLEGEYRLVWQITLSRDPTWPRDDLPIERRVSNTFRLTVE
jgi:hypothetical protein